MYVCICICIYVCVRLCVHMCDEKQNKTGIVSLVFCFMLGHENVYHYSVVVLLQCIVPPRCRGVFFAATACSTLHK